MLATRAILKGPAANRKPAHYGGPSPREASLRGRQSARQWLASQNGLSRGSQLSVASCLLVAAASSPSRPANGPGGWRMALAAGKWAASGQRARKNNSSWRTWHRGRREGRSRVAKREAERHLLAPLRADRIPQCSAESVPRGQCAELCARNRRESRALQTLAEAARRSPACALQVRATSGRPKSCVCLREGQPALLLCLTRSLDKSQTRWQLCLVAAPEPAGASRAHRPSQLGA